eukprot:NODE_4718_length_557_cov_1639.039370_g2566_i1.p2 GENE.NODE_4718_length_557_cov_1639.039370_g2566_i1~~NODE_4718_length_557_cov_1639.039370_g2566_i1.p2  ORF type:complete len:135 (-),score=32.35 NODE_4718_length_557_cov_1639.039370_g2566_i1:125-529(-)
MGEGEGRICRRLAMDFQTVGKQFATHYYQTFDSNRDGLGALYRDQSLMTFEGSQAQGTAQIMTKLKSLSFQKVQHDVKTIDCQPSPSGGVIVLVSGMLKTDGDEPQFFSQSFHLVAEGTNFWLSNDVFRLVLGA